MQLSISVMNMVIRSIFFNKTENIKAKIDFSHLFVLQNFCLSFAEWLKPKYSAFAISGDGKLIESTVHCL